MPAEPADGVAREKPWPMAAMAGGPGVEVEMRSGNQLPIQDERERRHFDQAKRRSGRWRVFGGELARWLACGSAWTSVAGVDGEDKEMMKCRWLTDDMELGHWRGSRSYTCHQVHTRFPTAGLAY